MPKVFSKLSFSGKMLTYRMGEVNFSESNSRLSSHQIFFSYSDEIWIEKIRLDRDNSAE